MLSQPEEVTVKEISFAKNPTSATKDEGGVRIGVMSLPFPPVRSGPKNVADDGKVRLGVMSPAFPTLRAR
jgi:hypothetical protein